MNKSSLYLPLLEQAFKHATSHLKNMETARVSASVELEELRRRLRHELQPGGIPANVVLNDLIADVSGGLLTSGGGRFFGWVIGGCLPVALAADWITSAWDQNGAIHATSPAVGVVEEVAGDWLKEILALPKTASFAFVTGCQMAHFTCLAAARHKVLARVGWDVERNGLIGAPVVRIFGSDQRHGSVERAVRFLGFGTDNITTVPCDQQGQLIHGALEELLSKQPDLPAIVLLQAGELNTGSFDHFAEIIPVAHKYNAWVHVDGAFGLWAAVSSELNHLLKGADQADSWATDGHKWLNVPFECGYAFVADAASHRAAMSYSASYFIHESGARDEMDWNPEWSRRARAFATYAVIRHLGKSGIAELVEQNCRQARRLVQSIANLPGVELVSEPIINQGLVRFLDPKPSATEEDHDTRTDKVIRTIIKNGEAFFGGTKWNGKRCMRVSVCSWQTDDNDIERVVRAVQNALLS
ncbi:aminotransferase class V-fold PLP-dependent enzyme [bacterium]|nr:aminotransferase class V-fold PLP-dependent enzyme [bacterium]MCI0601449.1 aminotransferase class V-fold PLP-dependent enzyme [bacterium]